MNPTASGLGFGHVVETLDELAGVYGAPEEPAREKAVDHLDRHCRDFIARSPFVLLATCDSAGRCDVSPRGGLAGFVEVLDTTRLVFADAKGNRRVDSLSNIVDTGRAGLLFVIPGLEETLRVNGRACLTRDPEILERHVRDGKVPKLAVGVDVEEAFLHCAKAFKRSSLWRSESWPSLDGLARPAEIWRDHVAKPGLTTELVQDHLDEDYAQNLY